MKRTAIFAVALAGLLWAGFGHSFERCDKEIYAAFVNETVRCVDEMMKRIDTHGMQENANVARLNAIASLCRIEVFCEIPPVPTAPPQEK